MGVDEQITTYFNLYFLMGKRKIRKIILTASEKMDMRLLCKGELEYYVRVEKEKRTTGEPAEVTEKPLPSLQQGPGVPCHPFRAIPVSEKHELYLSSV